MGQSYNTAHPKRPAELLNLYSKYLPNVSSLASGTGANTALDQLKATNTSLRPGVGGAPLGINELNLQQMQELGPQFTQTGAQAAGGMSAINRALNPEYYKAAGAAAEGAARGVNAIDMTGLSPGEANAIERSLNQTKSVTGNAGLVNPTNVISDAMNFGGAYNNKVNLLANATNTAGNVANATASNAGFSPTNTATQFGQGQFVNASAPVVGATPSTNALNFASGLLSSLTSGNNAAQSAGASMANTNSAVSYLGSVCCFIFLEAYHGNIPKNVRKGRDKFYFKNHDIATGYRRMAKWLVPLMQSSPLVRWLVWHLMVSPITDNLEHLHNNWKRTVTHFWLRVWAIMGKGKCETDYAMTWKYV